jgi:hypothetical protein
MPCVVVDGWVPGMNPIRLVQLLRANTGLGLANAKHVVDAFLEHGRPIAVPFIDGAAAAAFAHAATELGTRTRITDEDCAEPLLPE